MTSADTIVRSEPTVPEASPRIDLVRIISWVAVFLAPAAAQLAYGTHDVGLVEEWGLSQLFDSRGSGVFWTPSAGSGLEGQAIRPLTVVPHSIAFALDHDSFVWYHILNAAGLGLKGLAMLALLVQLRVRRSIAVGGAFIFALFPAWTGLFTFRMIHGEFALAALVFAVAQLIAYARRPSVWRGVAIGVALAVSLMSYEAGYVVVLLAPAILFVVLRPSWKHLLHVCSVWYAVPLVNGIRILAVVRSGQPLYQREILVRTSRRPLRELRVMLELVFRKGFLGFVSGPMGMTVSLVAVVSVALIGTAMVLGWRRPALAPADGSNAAADDADTGHGPAADSAPEDRRDRRLVLLCVGSLIAAPLGVLVYAGNSILLVDPLRVFSVASFPLALAVVAAAELIARRREVVAVGLVIALVALAAASATGQRDWYHERSTYQENVLGAIVPASLEKPAARSIIVIDPEHVVGGGPTGDMYRFIPEYLQLAVMYIRPSIGQVLVCHQPIDQMPIGTSASTECSVQDGVVTNYLGLADVDASAVIELRHARDPRWPAPADEPPSTHRERSVLPCVVTSSCDDGKDGVEARVVTSGSGT